jgi:hypothetical protein
MNILLEIPEDLSQRLQDNLGDLSQWTLELIAVEAYRAQIISAAEVQCMLKLPSRLATDGFLKQHEAYLHYSEVDLEQDIAALDKAL